MNENLKKIIAEYANKSRGCVSVRAGDGNICIIMSPRGGGEVSAADAVFAEEGRIESLPPEIAERASRHFAVYGRRSDAACIIESAPDSVLAAAGFGMDIPPVTDDMAQIVGPSARTANSSSAKAILAVLRGRNVCLIKNEGCLAVGRTINEAMAGVSVLDKAAHTYIVSAAIGGSRPVGRLTARLEHMVYLKSYSAMNQKILAQSERGDAEPADAESGKGANFCEPSGKPQGNTDTCHYTDPEKEAEIRRTIIACGRRMAEENLVQGTWGNISMRLDESHALITPSGLDYAVLKPEDLPILNIKTMEWTGHLKPTSEKMLHAAILSSRLDVNMVLHSHPVWSMAFASSRIALPVREESAGGLPFGDVPCAEYALAGTKKLSANVLKAMREGNACLLANHGIFVCGADSSEAFDICRCLEDSCRAYIERKTCEWAGEDEYSFDLSVRMFAEKMRKGMRR